MEGSSPPPPAPSCRPTPVLAWGPLWFAGHPLLVQPSSTSSSSSSYSSSSSNNGSGDEDGASDSGEGPKEKTRRRTNICSSTSSSSDGDDDDDDDDGMLSVASGALFRRLVDVGGSTRLELSGRVLDGETCRPVPGGAVVDVWHTDPKGRYSLESDGSCRGAVSTDNGTGAYSVSTRMPGSYGITAGCGHHSKWFFGMELPPYSLRHIHVAVFAPGYNVLTTQLTFPDDPTRGFDFREVLGGVPLSDPAVVLDVVKKKQERGPSSSGGGSYYHEATWDFVLVKNESIAQNLYYNATALRQVVCPAVPGGRIGLDMNVPYYLCHSDGLARYLSIRTLATVLLPAAFYAVPLAAALTLYAIAKKVAGVLSSAEGDNDNENSSGSNNNNNNNNNKQKKKSKMA